MFILTVVEAPVNKLEYLSAILFHGFLSSLQSGFIDPNSAVVIDSIDTTTFTCQLCFYVRMKKKDAK